MKEGVVASHAQFPAGGNGEAIAPVGVLKRLSGRNAGVLIGDKAFRRPSWRLRDGECDRQGKGEENPGSQDGQAKKHG